MARPKKTIKEDDIIITDDAPILIDSDEDPNEAPDLKARRLNRLNK